MTTTKTTSAIPPTLATALIRAEALLTARDTTFVALAQTHTRIPELLAERARLTSELGLAELGKGSVADLRRRLEATETKRTAAVRQRRAALETLDSQQPELRAAREALDEARTPYVNALVTDFQKRYTDVVTRMQALWREAEHLGISLRCSIPTALPVKLEGGMTRDILGFPEHQVEAKLVRVPGEVANLQIDATAIRIGQVLDRLDSARFNLASLETSDSLLLRRTLEVPAGFSPDRTFVVLKPFTSSEDGLLFEPGVMIDNTLVGAGSLLRLFRGKHTRMLNLSESASAA